jgi:hypothetical protein
MYSHNILQSDDSLKLSVEEVTTIVASINNGDLEIKNIQPSKKKAVTTAQANDIYNIFTSETSNTDDTKGLSETGFIRNRAEKALGLVHTSTRKIKDAPESKVDNKQEKHSESSNKTSQREKSPVKTMAESQSEMFSEEESLKQRQNYERLTSTQTQVVSQLQKHQLQKEDEGSRTIGQT